MVVVLKDGLTRDLGGGSDTWQVGPLGFSIHTPVQSLPDPATDEAGLLHALLPAITATITLDNRNGKLPRTIIFGINPGSTCFQIDEQLGGAVGVAWNRECGIASPTPGATSWVHWNERDWFNDQRSFTLGQSGGIALFFVIPAIWLVSARQGQETRLRLLDCGYWLLAYLTMGTVFWALR